MRSYETLIRWNTLWCLWFSGERNGVREYLRDHLLMIDQAENGLQVCLRFNAIS